MSPEGYDPSKWTFNAWAHVSAGKPLDSLDLLRYCYSSDSLKPRAKHVTLAGRQVAVRVEKAGLRK